MNCKQIFGSQKAGETSTFHSRLNRTTLDPVFTWFSLFLALFQTFLE